MTETSILKDILKYWWFPNKERKTNKTWKQYVEIRHNSKRYVKMTRKK